MGEDINFCHRWRALGGRIFVDPGIPVRHFGEIAHDGCLEDMLPMCVTREDGRIEPPAEELAQAA